MGSFNKPPRPRQRERRQTKVGRIRDELSVRITDTRTTLRRICANNNQRELYNRIGCASTVV